MKTIDVSALETKTQIWDILTSSNLLFNLWDSRVSNVWSAWLLSKFY